jgi:glycosyltransferase involved in cell wall biosynthesis
MYKLSVIVPVYNESDTINILITRLLGVPELADGSTQFIIVDDGSIDGTAELLKSSAQREDPRFVFIFGARNRGKGAAIRQGLERASGEYTVIQDADLEYDPHDIHSLLEKAQREKLTAVYGSRLLNKSNRRGKAQFYLGGKLVTWLANLLYRQRLTDEPTCYKLFRTDVLKSLPLRCRQFEFCPEVTAMLARRGIRIAEVPIQYFPRDKKSGKKIKWQDGLEAIWTLLRLRFGLDNRYALALAVAGFAFFLYILTWQRTFGGYEGETALAAGRLWSGHYEVKRAGLGALLLYMPFIGIFRVLHITDFKYFTLIPIFYSAVSMGILFLCLERMKFRRSAALAASLLVASASVVWPYANIGMEYQAMLYLLLLFLSLVIWQEKRADPLWVGVALAFLSVAKSYGIMFALPMLLFVCIVLKDSGELVRLRSPKFLLRLFLPVVALYSLTMILAYMSYGTLSGAYSLSHEFQITCWWEGFYGIFFSAGKSIFLYSPLLLLTLFFWPEFYRKHRPAAWFIATAFVLLLLVTAPFSYWSDETWGVRKLVSITPLLSLPLALLFEKDKLQKGKSVLAISAVVAIILFSVYVQVLGASYSYGKQLVFLRENNLDSLSSMRYIPQLSQINLDHEFLVSYLGGAHVFHYEEMSWFRPLGGENDVAFHEVATELRQFDRPDIVWLAGVSRTRTKVFIDLFLLAAMSVALFSSSENDRLHRRVESEI